MKNLFFVQCLAAAGSLLFTLFSHTAAAQCKEKINESTGEKVHYHEIILTDKNEFLTISRTGDERIFSYNNKLINLVFPVQTFTEIKFTGEGGTFSLFTTSGYRSQWHRIFALSSPLTRKEIGKLRNVTSMQVILPEEVKRFTFDDQKRALFKKAMDCLK